MDRGDGAVYADRFRDPVVARAGTRHLPNVPAARDTSGRKASRDAPSDDVPIRAVLDVHDKAVHRLTCVAPETANADDYTLEKVDATHFIIDERPDSVRARLIAPAEETGRVTCRQLPSQFSRNASVTMAALSAAICL